MNPVNTPHITALRSHLMETLASLRDRNNPMEPDRARAVAQIAGVLVDTARVEVDYIKATGADHSNFLEADTNPVAQIGNGPSAHNPFPVSARNRLVG